MKNYSYKIAIVATSIVMAYFATGIATIAQATELLKAEPVKQASLISQAQANLALSFSTIAIAPSSTQDSAKNLIAKKAVTENQNRTVTLSKTSLISE
jgi:hypothetical protein